MWQHDMRRWCNTITLVRKLTTQAEDINEVLGGVNTQSPCREELLPTLVADTVADSPQASLIRRFVSRDTQYWRATKARGKASTQGCSGKNILGHTLRPRVQGATQAPGEVRGSAPAAEALKALLMQIYAIQSHCEL